jgi:hypothetical protein
MKYIKQYEENKETFEVGDVVYCYDNEFYDDNIDVGVPYTITDVYEYDNISMNKNLTIITLEDKSFNSSRFTKDPNHPDIIKYTANKYNL